MRYNDVYFDFGMTPSEAEMLYRQINARLNDEDLEEHEEMSLRRFQDRVAAFTHKHPCEYGADAL